MAERKSATKGTRRPAKRTNGKASGGFTAEERAAKFFTRLGFRRVGPRDIPPAKWRGYDRARMSRLEIFRYDLD